MMSGAQLPIVAGSVVNRVDRKKWCSRNAASRARSSSTSLLPRTKQMCGTAWMKSAVGPAMPLSIA